jgi:hypothetical protein
MVDLRARDRDVAHIAAGVRACAVGVLVAIPIASAALMYVYEDLSGAGTKPSLAMSSPDA